MQRIFGWDSRQDMREDFFPSWRNKAAKDEGEAAVPEEEDILFASYEQEPYSGSAFVLFRRDGKFYEVHGSHCSCYGLEDQWEPEETTLAALRMRITGKPYAEWYAQGEQGKVFAQVLDEIDAASAPGLG